MENTPRKRILILGGGFAGLTVAMELEKTLADDPSVEITLINRENFFLFTPMLHEVAASDLDLPTIVNPARSMLRHVHFFAVEVSRIDIEQRRKLAGRKVEVHLNTKVEGFSGRAVRLSDGTTIHTNTLLWITSPNPLLETIPWRGRKSQEQVKSLSRTFMWRTLQP